MVSVSPAQTPLAALGNAPSRPMADDTERALTPANEVARLRWRCRRGMRELDRLLEGFFDRHYASLSEVEKRGFAQILELPDPDLRAYLLGKAEPEDAELARLLEIIRESSSV